MKVELLNTFCIVFSLCQDHTPARLAEIGPKQVKEKNRPTKKNNDDIFPDRRRNAQPSHFGRSLRKSGKMGRAPKERRYYLTQ
eukprot:6476665-Amphidinium_carterae.1